jgi:hypothetical protein
VYVHPRLGRDAVMVVQEEDLIAACTAWSTAEMIFVELARFVNEVMPSILLAGTKMEGGIGSTVLLFAIGSEIAKLNSLEPMALIAASSQMRPLLVDLYQLSTP